MATFPSLSCWQSRVVSPNPSGPVRSRVKRTPLVDALILVLAERRDRTLIFDDVRRDTIVAPMLCPGITRKEMIQRNLEMTTTSRDGVTGRMRGAIPHELPQSN